jgi:hypothetical protein
MNQRLGWKKMPVSVVQIHEGAKYRRIDRAEERHDTNIKKKIGGEIKKMNTKKGIAIGLAAVMISMIAACAVPMVGAEAEEYTATVTVSTIDITILQANTNFGEIARGGTGTIAQSLHIQNKGQIATMAAKFTTSEDSVYGMLSDNYDDVIPGTNFELEDVALNAEETDKEICQITKGTTWISADLLAPTDVYADSYTGTIELTFTAA